MCAKWTLLHFNASSLLLKEKGGREGGEREGEHLQAVLHQPDHHRICLVGGDTISFSIIIMLYKNWFLA